MRQKLPHDDFLLEADLAVNTIIDCGKSIMEIYQKEFRTSFKSEKEYLTEADIKSNHLIQKKLSSTNYPILSEESIDDKKRLESKIVWIIDPLDGTADFVNKTGEFTLMISLVKNQKPILGIIYWLTNNVLYLAQKDRGAFQFKNKKWSKITVSTISNIEDCRVLMSRHHISKTEENFLKYLNIKNYSNKGSSLKATEIASGCAEVYFTDTNKIKQWDTCASYCLIKEAGGNITDLNGNDLQYNTNEINHQNGILVTNGLIHDKLIKKYKEFQNKEN